MAASHASHAAALKVFLNAAGGGAREAREALADSGLDLQVIQPSELERRLKQEIDGGAKRIVVAGGDGTIATAASLVANNSIELAILPCGTLNHFAKDHGIPTDLAKAAVVAVDGSVVGADIAYVGDTIFLNTSSIGAYVSFVRVRERFEKHLGYRVASFFAFIRTWAHLRTFTVTLE
ncbi:MAG TPA: diacylglycerol kinase family protein, partial [Gemmatimonadaceae bacterium]|nr:diacylglycerol kinase family protein [Gemmatimonadaceae bacterium]